MFKSPIPLQTPIALKIILTTAIAILVVGWSLASDAEEKVNSQQSITLSEQERELNQLTQKIHSSINEYRLARNLKPLKLMTDIDAQAQLHSQNMAEGKTKFSHNGFERRIEAIGKNIDDASAAENVGYNQGYQDLAQQVVQGWIKSPAHHKNIIGNYNLTGLGVAKNRQGEYYFTQIFILEK